MFEYNTRVDPLVKDSVYFPGQITKDYHMEAVEAAKDYLENLENDPVRYSKIYFTGSKVKETPLAELTAAVQPDTSNWQKGEATTDYLRVGVPVRSGIATNPSEWSNTIPVTMPMVDDTMKLSGVKYDTDKPRMDLLPPLAILEVAKVLAFGAKKYAPGNWKKVDDLQNRYTAAALRHIMDHMINDGTDPESGIDTLAHAICCLMFKLEDKLGKDQKARSRETN